MIIFNKEKFHKIITELETLWTWKKYDPRIESIHIFARNLFKLYRIFTCFAILYFEIFNLVTGTDFAVFRSALCNMNTTICYWSYMVIVLCGCIVTVLMLTAFDGIFIGIIVYCYTEFKIMKYGLMSVNKIENPLRRFKEFTRIAEHHSQVLK